MTDPRSTARAARHVRLQVARANPQDVGRGTARLSVEALEQLGQGEGSTIEIVGRRATPAIALRSQIEDRELPLLRLDGLQRANAGVSIGDMVEVRPAVAVSATRITLAPTQPHAWLDGAAGALRRTLMGQTLVTGDILSAAGYHSTGSDRLAVGSAGRPAFGLSEIRMRVVSTSPTGIVEVSEATELELLGVPHEPDDHRRRGEVTYEDVGGLDDVIQQVREMLELPLKHPELFARIGIDPPKGVLLYGPPGAGKTRLARAVANEAAARFFSISGPEIIGPYQGQSEQRLRDIFEQAQAEAPAIVFMDEIDAIAPKRDAARGEMERRLVAQLLALMDGLTPRGNVIVIGATNIPDTLDEALRRPGRFDREIALGVPSARGRRDILRIHTRAMPLAADVDLEAIARITHGFVGADLAALTREAAMDALRRSLRHTAPGRDALTLETLEEIAVTAADFESAHRRVRPSAMRELLVQVPDVSWLDIGGVDEAVRTLRDGIELPLRRPEAFANLGIRAAKGFLLFGPPGTGKTLLAKAVAHEAEANFISVTSSDVLSKWYGESEREISRLFTRARQVAPVVIFLDEIDALAPQRGSAAGEAGASDRVVNTLLAELDGLKELRDVFVIGATNRPTLLDPALLRPGRLEELVYVPVPDRDGRRQILGILTAHMPLAADVDLDALADRTAGYTGADLGGLVRRAGLVAIRDDERAVVVSRRAFERALADSRASVSSKIEHEYEEILEQLRRESPLGRQIGFVARDSATS
jgi:transitional endoplasmic reticulum ATPase